MTGARPATGGGHPPSPPLPGPGNDNTIARATLIGPTVQAGSIHGGVHVHAPPAATLLPRQLPPAPAAFTDRETDIDFLASAIEKLPDYAVRVVVLSGEGGIGKTTLANRLLHLLAGQYPGGQLYKDLRGYAPEGPAGTGEALHWLLRSLLPTAQATSVQETAGWWRSATAAQHDRPVSILLDNACSGTQVRDLLPGGAGHLVVATSRHLLPELAPVGAIHHVVGPFDRAAAHTYLIRCLGGPRVAREPDAAGRLLRDCGGSPMAIALAVTQLAADPTRTLADVTDPAPAHAPHPSPGRQETPVSGALDQAYASLAPNTPPAVAYRRLGPTFAVDFDVPFAAAVCNLPLPDADDALRELNRCHLIELLTEDPARGRVYRFHDLARAHARARAAQEAPPGEAGEVLRRAVDFYLAATTEAERLLTRTHRRLRRDYVYPPDPIGFSDETAALAWLQAQQHNLLPAARAAGAGGLDRTTWQLSHATWPLLRSSHDFNLWFAIHDLGTTAARRSGDGEAETELLNTWGIGLRAAGRFEEARSKFGTVLQLARGRGDRHTEAQALHELGSVELHDNRLAKAEKLLCQAHTLRTELFRTSQSQLDQDTFRRAVALTESVLGETHLARGNPAEAIAVLTTAWTSLTEIGDRLDAARTQAWLARAHTAAGNTARGEEDGLLAVTACDTAGSDRWRARSRELLAHTLQESGRPGPARTLCQEAIAIYARISPRDKERVQHYLQGLV
ncbi:tetratricopeptide repeat protein [Streptomyces shenzhenensis]|uniref:tetratricopeptide repeat protein n=1 Tax=Streptomyces shenzhenensis TaxID=943815 RepID=UPI0033C593AD